jgi:hypothetical protein
MNTTTLPRLVHSDRFNVKQEAAHCAFVLDHSTFLST